MTKTVILTLALLTNYLLLGQEEVIRNATIDTCEGILIDTGGTIEGYSDNESFTMTICAESSEAVINLYWDTFNLGVGDELIIYDGQDTSNPLIGTYILADLESTTISSSMDGCLTLVWSSDSEGSGDFSAEISCGTPCEPPTAIVTHDFELPNKICVGEEFSIDASFSFAALGMSLESYEWNFGDGSNDTFDSPIITYSYDTPGSYMVQLEVTDNAGCSNTNSINILIQVSTIPSFEGTTNDITVCPGVELVLNGQVSPQAWANDVIPDIDIDDPLKLADLINKCFISEAKVSGFDINDSISEVAGVANLFINMEHSYMGDLSIRLICPNGQSLITHAEGGNGVYIGEPIDDESQPELSGIGYDYFWSSDTTEPSWVDWTVQNDMVSPVPSGIYASQEPWENLVGCPINGVWTLEICDRFASDNGFVFDWSINFDSSFYNVGSPFTPSFGAECDSTYWVSNDINVDEFSSDCDSVTVSFSEEGEYIFTYNAIDNHGCLYTHDVEVIVSDINISTSLDEPTVCLNESFLISSDIESSAGQFQNLIYSWVPSEPLLDTVSNAAYSPFGVETETVFIVTAFPEGFPECAVSDEVTITPLSSPTTSYEMSDWCPSESSILTAVPEGAVDSLNWFTFVEGEYLGNTPTITVLEGGNYLLTVFGCDNQSDSDTLFVEAVLCSDVSIFELSADGKEAIPLLYQSGYASQAKLSVFDRTGALVLEEVNYQGNWRSYGHQLVNGVYVYSLSLSDGRKERGMIPVFE